RAPRRARNHGARRRRARRARARRLESAARFPRRPAVHAVPAGPEPARHSGAPGGVAPRHRHGALLGDAGASAAPMKGPLVAIGGGWGTLSEIALARRTNTPVVGLHDAFTSALEIHREAGPEAAVRWALEQAGRHEV